MAWHRIAIPIGATEGHVLHCRENREVDVDKEETCNLEIN